MKKFFYLTFALLLCSRVFSQNVIVQHNEKGLFATHTVAPKETFYSLGRLYAIPPKEIAAYNNLEMERGLTIGQVVNIPLTKANFSQEKATVHPVYYVVGEKEGLYRVSVNNNKVLMANLRKWNNLQSDAVTAGQKLIVGYLLSTEPAPQNTSVAKAASIEAQTPVEKPVERKPEPQVKVTEREVEQPAAKEPPVERRPEPTKQVLTQANESSAGYFKPAFEAQVKAQPLSKDEVATAGIFKTASGWQDAKYYALIDGVEPGTIIRVVNPQNNQAIYAKVLDRMTGIRQNQGYNVRISNAAATALGVGSPEKFSVRVNY